MDNHTKGIVATIVAAFIWSTAGLFVKLLPQDAFTILFYRSLFSSIAFFVILRGKALLINKWTIFGALAYAPLVFCFVTSTKMTSAANAIFLQYAAPAYILILEPYFFKTKLRRIDVITVIACLVGMVLFFFEQFEQPDNLTGIILALMAGFFLAALLLIQRKNDPDYQPGAIFYGNIIVVICMYPWFSASPYPQGIELGYLAFLGFIQLGLGFVLFTYGQRYINAIESSLLAMIEPMLNPLWVMIGYGEYPSRWAYLGGAIILSSLVIRLLLIRRMESKLVT
jgi:drug/metabolite transporter, DME family